MTSLFNATDIIDTITAISPLGGAVTTLVVGFVGLILTVALIGFITGVFDDILAGIRNMFTFGRKA